MNIELINERIEHTKTKLELWQAQQRALSMAIAVDRNQLEKLYRERDAASASVEPAPEEATA